MPLDQEVAKRLRYVNVPVICVANKTDHPSSGQPGRRVLSASARQAASASARRRTAARPSCSRPIARAAAAEAAGRRRAARRAGDEGGDRRPPQRGQEHVRQHAGPGRADDRQRSARHDARQRRRALRAGRQDVHGHRHARLPPRQEHHHRHRLLQHAPGPAEHPPGRRGAACSSTPSQRISKVDKQLCDYIAQQYKPCIFVVNKWDLMAGKMPTEKWVTYLRDTFRTMLVRADRLHHRPDGQERQGAAQPRADALQAVADAADARRS